MAFLTMAIGNFLLNLHIIVRLMITPPYKTDNLIKINYTSRLRYYS